MRVLLDSTFPATATGPQPHGHHIDRYDAGAIGDTELVQWASTKGYDVVVFLGSDSLAASIFTSSEPVHGVVVCGTSSTDPGEAEVAVRSNLAALASRLDSESALVIRKSGIVEV